MFGLTAPGMAATETPQGQPAPTRASEGAPPLLRYALLTTAATLGLSGAAAAVVSALSGYLVYQYARARGPWGSGEPPEGTAEEVTFLSDDHQVTLSGWFFAARGVEPGTRCPSLVLSHGIWTGRRECLPLALRFSAAGYNVLCFDFRAHGLSGGEFTSVGFRETDDVLGAV